MYEKYVKLRDERGFTDYGVAIGSDVTKSTFTDWKNGRSEPKLDKLIKIANFLGVTIDYFLETTAEQNKKGGE
ncbi:helix-turn-helix domain-containing protein [Kineothrix sp. MB12-C1]|uniref:helix-turn-helix domain-containing protein n=1 Tax=Kineothrix sp. MB12-C1 TaxID=3070215 RepID=UPI0027D314F9|nr:helix-turn-helix transcriptional regulator [Kineothrix sp. MB12-C1]WMC91217.1 helix-turn-helix transcriptional regulator [Kineothrix sp. MB12-C1]